MFNMLLGHMVGDYLLQTNWMALNKNKHNGLGWISCTVHCILYTLAVCAIMNVWSPLWVLSVFASHFVIDKFGIAEHYLKLVKGRSIQSFLDNPENQEYTPHVALRSGITVFVYIVVDNTMHLLLMALAYNFIFI